MMHTGSESGYIQYQKDDLKYKFLQEGRKKIFLKKKHTPELFGSAQCTEKIHRYKSILFPSICVTWIGFTITVPKQGKNYLFPKNKGHDVIYHFPFWLKGLGTKMK